MVGIFKKLFKKEKITKKYKNGDTYVGEVKNDKHHGQGTYTWADGRKYVGSYVADKKEGYGIFTWPDGRQYAGNWSKGR